MNGNQIKPAPSSFALPGFDVLLRLGRVSNLPTVWSNVLAGSLVACQALKQPPNWASMAWVMLAVSLFYCGGMYLNDAFDRHIDARERPSRPIPSGKISASTVFVLGFLQLGLAVLMLCQTSLWTVLTALLLAGMICLYNVWHKGNHLSPLFMGACRALVYVLAGAVVLANVPAGGIDASPNASGFTSSFTSTAWPWALVVAALAGWAHVVGLTYAAKQENLNRIERWWPLAILLLPLLLYASPIWQALHQVQFLPLITLLALVLANALALRHLRQRAVPQAVGQFIAAISLLDALLVALALGTPLAVLFCLVAFACTRLLQRVIPGT